MAFKISVLLDNGIHLKDSYAKIITVGGGAEGAVIELYYYLDKIKCEEGFEPVRKEYHYFIPSLEDGSENFIKQGYEYLAASPEFENAIPVL